MSLTRLIVWSTLIGGWAAFFGWLFAELALHWFHNFFITLLMITLVAIPIGGGICLASGLTSPRMDVLLRRLVLGSAGGLAAGLVGGLLGSLIFLPVYLESVRSEAGVFVLRVLGFTTIGICIGAGIGASEGIVERSFHKMRNGLIGGVVGGLVGGIFLSLVLGAGSTTYGNTSRAVSFVLLGMCIGLAIGLAQVLLKQAWLTVEAGFRPGRQLILGESKVTMGRSEKSSIIFIAFGAK